MAKSQFVGDFVKFQVMIGLVVMAFLCIVEVGGEDGIPICYAKSGDDNGQNMTITRVDCSDETATFDARTVTVGELLNTFVPNFKPTVKEETGSCETPKKRCTTVAN